MQKKKLGLSPNLRYICFVGNLAPWQGVEYIIKVAPLVIEKFSKVRFLIVGDGAELNKLKKLAQEQGIEQYIIFTGRVPYTKTPEYISASEFCLAPWIPERNNKIGLSPLKLYSYLAVGKPVVTSKIPGVYEEIEKNELGKIVDTTNLEEFASAITEFLGKRAKLASPKQAIDFIDSTHTWKRVASLIYKFIT